MPRLQRLLTRLSAVLPRDAARLELKWLQQAAARDPRRDLDVMVDRRIDGEPLQYIIGTQPFGPLELLVRPPVLIPRPETEDWALRLAERVLPSVQRPVSLLDLCTGTGCIPLVLCRLCPAGSVSAYGVDIAEEAIALARENARLHGIPEQNTGGPALTNIFRPVLANMRDPAALISAGLRPPFDVITSNPPYIPKNEYDNLPPSVKDYEDQRALLGDPEPGSSDGKGLTFYRDIAKLVAHHDFLARDGLLAVEVGAGQARDVEQIFQGEGKLSKTEIWQDPWQVERVVLARR
ncbi:S-adenosyl-L-methionine-dependent methyltransferase [Panus rudis PR-1116 ss-1]|nr:S-adenosyl-L-methionine-dependent methyltransferase [Panus rudis PR-1116 ss-1]